MAAPPSPSAPERATRGGPGGHAMDDQHEHHGDEDDGPRVPDLRQPEEADGEDDGGQQRRQGWGGGLPKLPLRTVSPGAHRQRFS